MAEGAPLLREYTLKAYRGFESLLLRQNSLLIRGLFCVWEGEKPRRFDKMQRILGAEGGSQDCVQTLG